MNAIVGTKLAPQGVFNLVGLLPKEHQDRFRKDCWVEEKQDETEFVADPVMKYDHVLGLTWLTNEGIPNTQEELDAQREFLFQTMISGPERYNIGEFFVLFPNIVYTSSDIGDKLMIVEVMDELEFPANIDLTTQALAEYNQYGYMNREALAIRAALRSYITEGKIKIHEGNMRMYACSEQYKFEANYKNPDEKPLSFKELARRRRS